MCHWKKTSLLFTLFRSLGIFFISTASAKLINTDSVEIIVRFLLVTIGDHEICLLSKMSLNFVLCEDISSTALCLLVSGCLISVYIK